MQTVKNEENENFQFLRKLTKDDRNYYLHRNKEWKIYENLFISNDLFIEIYINESLLLSLNNLT